MLFTTHHSPSEPLMSPDSYRDELTTSSFKFNDAIHNSQFTI
jgi:hypothetical protein